MIDDTIDKNVDTVISSDINPNDWDVGELNHLLLPIFPFDKDEILKVEEDAKDVNELKKSIKEAAYKLYEAKEAEFPENVTPDIRELERIVILKTIDRKWMDHIDDMDQLRQGIGLQAMGQRDPVVEYKFAGFDMFNDMISSIQEDTVKVLNHVRIEENVEREEVAKVTGTNKDDSVAKGPKKRDEAKVYPNDPCPCGSGKKYKNCCGRN